MRTCPPRRTQIDFNFPHKEGTSLHKLLPHCSSDCVELITKLLAYDPDDRLSARQAVKHPYFRDIREQEKRAAAAAHHSHASAAETDDGGGGGLLPPAGGRARGDKHKGGGGMLPDIPNPKSHPTHTRSTVEQQTASHHGGKMRFADHQPPDAHDYVAGGSSGATLAHPPMGASGAAHGVHGQGAHGHLHHHGEAVGCSAHDDHPASTLPPIGGHYGHMAGGVASLKIDSKSLLAQKPIHGAKPQKFKAPTKKATTGRTQARRPCRTLRPRPSLPPLPSLLLQNHQSRGRDPGSCRNADGRRSPRRRAPRRGLRTVSLARQVREWRAADARRGQFLNASGAASRAAPSSCTRSAPRATARACPRRPPPGARRAGDDRRQAGRKEVVHVAVLAALPAEGEMNTGVLIVYGKL